MTRDEFISRVKEELMEMIPEELREGLEIQDTMVLKTNDQKHHGLTFKREESDAARAARSGKYDMIIAVSGADKYWKLSFM